MYIPSNFIVSVLKNEQIGVFCESNTDGDKAIIGKLPSSAIKSIALGAKLEFYVLVSTKKPHYIAFCMKVYDNLSQPLHAFLAQRWVHSNNILDFSFFDTDIELVLFDETDMPVQEATIRLKTNFKNKRIKQCLTSMKLESASDYGLVNQFTDSALATLGFPFSNDPAFPILQYKFNVFISDIHSKLSFHINEQGLVQYNISEDIDGNRQENQIYQSLCLVSDSRTYNSPMVTIGKKARELTDIFTVSNFGQLIAIESKCLKVDHDTASKENKRTSSSIIKHCIKALDQLEGVAKAIKREEKVAEQNGQAISLSVDSSFYGIVLIDEYRPSPDWAKVIEKMAKLSEQHNICLNIITVSELIYTIKLCNSDISLFIESLDTRFAKVLDVNSVNIKFINSTLPTSVE
ncbi:hypothetical protein ACRZ5S_20740 [Vibrio scophthalmi]|uniref:hypothetical protein n=1 Tax=Vibrio scophthalmi TaxID=45658 RepID=UPI003EBE5607